MKSLSEIKEQATGLILPICLLGGCGYLIFRPDNTPPPKNEKWCSMVKYFDTASERYVYSYRSTVFFNDSLVNFTDPHGEVYGHDFFAEDEKKRDDDKLDYDDITLKDGTRYVITQISEGGCKIDAIEDSLQDNLRNPDDDNDEN